MNDKADLELKELLLKEERLDADLTAKKERMAIEAESKLAESQRSSERTIIQVYDTKGLLFFIFFFSTYKQQKLLK